MRCRIAVVVGLSLSSIACRDATRDESPSEHTPSKEAPPEPKPEPSPRAEPAPRPEPEAEPDAPSAPCDTLDRAECLRSLACTMHWVKDGEYACRPSQGPCEENMTQGDRKACQSRAGCAWDPGSCYCPFPGYGHTQVKDKAANDGDACACGGGPPPICKAG